MKKHLAACAVGLALATSFGAAETPPSALKRIYVNKDHTCERVEFLPDGKCFLKVCSGYYTGTDGWDGDTCVCKADGESGESVRLTRQGATPVDDESRHWVPRDTLVKLPWSKVEPVTFVVVDSNTGQPVREFSYTYTIATPNAEFDPLLPRRTDVRAEDGAFTIDAPESCEFDLSLEGPDLVGGYGSEWPPQAGGWRHVDGTT